MLERITFLLAVLGYIGLTTTAVLAASGRFPRFAWRAAVLIIVLHVGLVWGGRYQWRLSEATRNGYVGFLVFHGALALIVTSVFVEERVARACAWAAFVIVTVGALGAVFRYDVVAPYRVPVILVAGVGIAGLTRAFWQKRRRIRTAA